MSDLTKMKQKMSEEKVFFRKRAFLNDMDVKNYPSAIVGEIIAEGNWPWCDLKISSCREVIELEFSVGDDNYDNSLKKLDTLINFLTEYKEALIKAQEYCINPKKE